MKICSKCKKNKSEKDFHKDNRRKDGLLNKCKSCVSENRRDYYADNEQYREKVAKRKEAQRIRNRQFILKYLEEHPCVDCGESDPIVLEFDHVRGLKDSHIGKLIGQGVGDSRLVKEITKCEVRCANCHRRRTLKVLGSYKIGGFAPLG